ncbi:unnamed protein product [Mucor hiemalis]
MATALLNSDYKDELLHINEDPLFEYGFPFVMDNLYPNDIRVNIQENSSLLESCRTSDCSSEEEEFDFKLTQPQAPPPSPQDTSMLDMLFASKLTSSLEACLVNNDTSAADYNDSNTLAIEKLSTTTKLSQNNTRGICKKTHKRSCSLQNHPLSWQTRANNQRLSSIAKAAEQADKLRKALQKHLVDEETTFMINELKDMGL